MTTYLVRIKETKQALGIYTASTMSGLFDLIDETLSPYVTEFSRATFGAVRFCKDTPIRFGPDEEETAWGEDTCVVTVFGDFADAATPFVKRKWRAFPCNFHAQPSSIEDILDAR